MSVITPSFYYRDICGLFVNSSRERKRFVPNKKHNFSLSTMHGVVWVGFGVVTISCTLLFTIHCELGYAENNNRAFACGANQAKI